MTINRGESLQMLSVNVAVPVSFRHALYDFAKKSLLSDGLQSRRNEQNICLDNYNNFFFLVRRQVREDLTTYAENAAIKVISARFKNAH